jgi:hypothetical protein
MHATMRAAMHAAMVRVCMHLYVHTLAVHAYSYAPGYM